ncbi:MAG: TonB-dependent receptor [Cyanobacteria bacterium]|nr:TonB-dependent receptor [Cyanobacteriota bacterium]
MRTPSRLIGPIVLCLAALHSTYAAAQTVKRPPSVGTFKPVTIIAAADTGFIEGKVTDEGGLPLDGAVISALGGTTAFAVSDRTGSYTLRQLPPGPYLVRVHLTGFLAARSSMVNVRPSTKSASSFTLRREGAAIAPRIAEAGVATIGAAPATPASKMGDRDESELGWRLRHVKRGVLRDAQTLARIPDDDDWFITDSFEFLGRAVGTSMRATKSLFSDMSLGGQVNLLTTGAFDNPLQLLQLDRTSSVAFFSVGAPVGSHGDWNVRAAMNQSDLSSWMLAGSYVVKAQVPHRYRFGMSYSLQRYEGGNTVALGALSDTARNVGSVFAYDEWQISRYIAVSYGGSYARYDYMDRNANFSPSVSATFSPAKSWRMRASASRHVSAPGAEEFIPPSSAAYLPPQRTFSPISKTGMRPQTLQNYEFAIERVMNGATIAVRGFEQRIDDQTVTVFGLRRNDAASLGHYYVGAAGDASVRGAGVTFTHALADNIRGSVDYSVATANWTDRAEPLEFAVLARFIPSAVRPATERIHDVTTSLETEIPYSATRVVVLYKLNTAFAAPDRNAIAPAFGARFDLQVNQALPFMNFRASQWEMLVGVRNLFHESLANTSAYDEILVVRPPKRLVGGLTVKF